ncbi:hypothetical protein ACTHHL_00420 [Aeribacillus composti]|uniref:hypothetical protein n=1 Tax=Aeribacillus composti TaxID=1868734 RepID=UPI00406A91C4
MMHDEIILIMVVIKLGLDILNKSIDLFSKMNNLIPKKEKNTNKIIQNYLLPPNRTTYSLVRRANSLPSSRSIRSDSTSLSVFSCSSLQGKIKSITMGALL